MGEIRGVRRTVDRMIRQEMKGRPACDLPRVKREVRAIARDYERRVRSGQEPPPPLANQG
jgi:hypothetical protein